MFESEITFTNGIKANITHPTRLRRPVLKSRATTILEATSTSVIRSPRTRYSLKREDLIVKASWAETTRADEADTITHARNVLWQAGAERKHLPILFASLDVPSSNTEGILLKLGVNPARGSSTSRVLQLLLFRRLVPLEKLSDEDLFMKAWLDCFKCHYSLWQHGIKHGDISVWNLMWDEKEQCGVLNDFDLATVETRPTDNVSQLQERTGTLPFIARDLLDEPPYLAGSGTKLYRFELESFVWVFVWMCFKESNVYDVRQWYGDTETETLYAKFDFLSLHYRMQSPLVHAWKKGKLLLKILLRMDAAQLQQGVFDEVHGRPHSQVVFDDNELFWEVVNIIIDPMYSIADLPKFVNRLRGA